MKKDAVQRFIDVWEANDYPVGDMQREYRFHPVRKWRFDLAWPSQLTAIEVDGIGYGHNSIKGQKSDCEKQNEAVVAGWRVFRYSTAMLNSAEQVEHATAQVAEFMCGVSP